MHYLTPTANGRNVLGLRAQLGYVQGFGGDVAPPNNRFYSGGEGELRGFDIRGATPYGYVPNRVTVQLTNPDGGCVPRDPTNPQLNQCILVPIPVYGIASIGGDTNLTTNAEYRIPIAGPVTFSFFDDFGIDAATNHGQLKQSPEGFASLTAPLYGCPVYNNGSCQGGIPDRRSDSSRTSGRSRAPTSYRACPRAPKFRSSCQSSTRPSASITLITLCGCMSGPSATMSASAATCKAARPVDYPRFVPAGWRRRLHLPGSYSGLRSKKPVPGTSQNLPLDRFHHVLIHTSSAERKGRSQRAALSFWAVRLWPCAEET